MKYTAQHISCMSFELPNVRHLPERCYRNSALAPGRSPLISCTLSATFRHFVKHIMTV